MDPLLIKTILSAGVVSALVSGIIGYFTAGRVERIKYQLSVSQELTKRLGEAHNDLLGIKNSSKTAHLKVANDVDATFNELDTALTDISQSSTANFDSAKDIYYKIRPLLGNKDKKIIDEKLVNCKAMNNQCADLLNAPRKDQNKALLVLMNEREAFISVLKKQTELAYGKMFGG